MKTFLKKNTIWLTFFMSAVVMLVIAFFASEMMMSSAETIEKSSMENMLALSRAAALLVPAEELDRFAEPEDMYTAEYAALKEKIIAFNRLSGTEYTYYLRLDTDANGMQFIIDNTAEDYSALSIEPVPREYAPDLALTGVANTVEIGSYSEDWEGYMTAFAPVYYSDGSLSNTVAGVDALDFSIREARKNMSNFSLLLTVSIVAVFSACFYSLLLYRRKVKQAQTASEAKSAFLSRMSHEIRTPLSAIVGFCGMSAEADDVTKIKEYIGRINMASQHLRGVIDDVLDISKIEAGKLVLEFIPVSLSDELEHIEHMIRPQTAAKGQQFIVNIDKKIPALLKYDVPHTRQIVVNLLSNAVKFTPKGGTVKLSVALSEMKGDRCNLLWRVEDNGIGISPEQQEKLFRPFEQADISTTRKYGGTGLGLSIAKQLVEMMGGAISVESGPEGGSKFTFNLWLDRVSESELASFENPGLHRQTADLSGKEILLVEDVETNQIIMQDMLEKYGAGVRVASNGLEGYNEYAANPDKYAMILMDVQMPVMDGYEATRKIRASGHANAALIPIVAMTANVYKEDVDRALAAGMTEHIGKPLDIRQIDRVFAKVFSAAG